MIEFIIGGVIMLIGVVIGYAMGTPNKPNND